MGIWGLQSGVYSGRRAHGRDRDRHLDQAKAAGRRRPLAQARQRSDDGGTGAHFIGQTRPLVLTRIIHERLSFDRRQAVARLRRSLFVFRIPPTMRHDSRDTLLRETHREKRRIGCIRHETSQMRKGNPIAPEIRIKQDPLSRPIRALFIPPPSDLLRQAGQIILKDGTVAELRVARPSDADTLRLFVDRLSPESNGIASFRRRGRPPRSSSHSAIRPTPMNR